MQDYHNHDSKVDPNMPQNHPASCRIKSLEAWPSLLESQLLSLLFKKSLLASFGNLPNVFTDRKSEIFPGTK